MSWRFYFGHCRVAAFEVLSVWYWFSDISLSVPDPDLEIGGGGGAGAVLRTSVWSKNKRRGWAPLAPPLDPPLSLLDFIFS